MAFVSLATLLDFKGSAAILVSMRWHLPHSKIRFSNPSLSGSDFVRGIRVLHLTQRGCSIAVGGMPADFSSEAMTLPIQQGRLVAARLRQRRLKKPNETLKRPSVRSTT